MDILIRNVLIGNEITDIQISGTRISSIGKKPDFKAGKIIEATGLAALPGLMNAHTHAAMTLMRGYADDIPLQPWLEQKIWPIEKKLTEEDVYWGARLAILEMIRSGTTFFNDMYWHFEATARAVHDSGIRASLASVFFDFGNSEMRQSQIEKTERLFEKYHQPGSAITFSLGPHAIYTVSEESLRWIAGFAREHDLLVTIHSNETQHEVEQCMTQHGCRPIEWLEKCGLTDARLLACHAIWVDENEMDIMAAKNITPVYNPVSNCKLASGLSFPLKRYLDRGIQPVLGTDGCASNNSLNMAETMKFAALIQKGICNDPTALPARLAFDMATSYTAKAFNLETGALQPGLLADIILVDLQTPEMTPCHNLISNMVYASSAQHIHTVICNGNILMENRNVKDEEEIVSRAKACAERLAG